MDNRILKGIASILFGILLCISDGEINRTVLHSVSDLPFALAGVLSGIAGLVMVFKKNRSDAGK